jgi:hypothetical protein
LGKEAYAACMLPATAWDDADWKGAKARGWTVMGRLRERERPRRVEIANAEQRRMAREERILTRDLTLLNGSVKIPS